MNYIIYLSLKDYENIDINLYTFMHKNDNNDRISRIQWK